MFHRMVAGVAFRWVTLGSERRCCDSQAVRAKPHTVQDAAGWLYDIQTFYRGKTSGPGVAQICFGSDGLSKDLESTKENPTYPYIYVTVMADIAISLRHEARGLELLLPKDETHNSAQERQC